MTLLQIEYLLTDLLIYVLVINSIILIVALYISNNIVYKHIEYDKNLLLELLQEYEFRISKLEKLEKRSKAHDKRLDYLDTKIQDLENIQSEVF